MSPSLLAPLKTLAHRALLLGPHARTPGAFLRNRAPDLRYASGEPTLTDPQWQLPTVAQCEEPAYAAWCAALGHEPLLRRKLWEWVYILRVLERHGMLTTGTRGIGFGCGTEPLAAFLASRGATVLATDLDLADAKAQGWVDSNQHALSGLNNAGLCPPDVFAERVAYRACDMNAIPADLRAGQFDFAWSACSLEHLGSHAHGLEFFERSLDCLRPGGIAVHTTEFNLGSNDRTVEQRALSIYRKRDIEAFARRMTQRGHTIGALNVSPGSGPMDHVIDLPPFFQQPLHLKLYCKRHIATSIGMYVVRGP